MNVAAFLHALALSTPLGIESEIFALSRILKGVGLIRVGLALLIGASVALLLVSGGRWLKRSGLDPNNRVMRVTTLLTVGVCVVVVNDLLRWFLKEIPLITLVVFVTLLTLFGIGTLNLLRDLMAGVGLVLRQRIYPGVHINIDGLEGTVGRIGPTTVQIYQQNGGVLHVANKRFRQTNFVTRSPSSKAQVDLVFSLGGLVTAGQIQETRRAALLCPYRSHASDVTVEVIGEESQSIKVAFYVPTQSVARRAEWFMRRTMESRFKG